MTKIAKSLLILSLISLSLAFTGCGKNGNNKNFLGLFGKNNLKFEEGFCGEVYDLSNLQPEELPSWGLLDSQDTFKASQLNFTDRASTEGFPGLDPEFQQWYGMYFMGRISVAEDGEYEFCEQSSDHFRFRLYDPIQGTDAFLLEDNVAHLPRIAYKKVNLKTGIYYYSLEYMQTDNDRIALHLTYEKDGQGGHAPVCSHGKIYTESVCRSNPAN